MNLLKVLGGVSLTTLAGIWLAPMVGYRAVGFLFLAAILGLSLFVPFSGILAGSMLSALVWDFGFIPPRWTFHIAERDDLFMLAAYLFVALATGLLTTRIRNQQRALEERGTRMQILYRVASSISATRDRDHLANAVSVLLKDELSCACDFQFAVSLNSLESREWVLQTESLLREENGALVFPLKGLTSMIGTMRVVRIACPDDSFLAEDVSLLKTISEQVAVATERFTLEASAAESARLKDSEKLHQVLLNSVSHELRTPLTTMLAASQALEKRSSQDASELKLFAEMRAAGLRLNRLFENLLGMSRIESGAMQLKVEMHDVADLVGVVYANVIADSAAVDLKNRIVTNVDPDIPLIAMDFNLVALALENLILNADAYAPKESGIVVHANCNEKELTLSVSDEGPGVPAALVPKIFEKFYRLPGSRAGGTGLGLAIAKSIAESHGGTLGAFNRPTGGLTVSLRLPLRDSKFQAGGGV